MNVIITLRPMSEVADAQFAAAQQGVEAVHTLCYRSGQDLRKAFTPTRMRLLDALHRCKTCSVADLSADMGLDVGPDIDYLVKLELLQREPDGRIVHLYDKIEFDRMAMADYFAAITGEELLAA